MDFELDLRSRKWGFVSVPDDIEIYINTGQQSQNIKCSLEELIAIFYHISSNEDYDDYVGIGSRVKIKVQNKNISITTRDMEAEIQRSVALRCLHSALIDVFSKKDSGSPTRDRKSALDAVLKKNSDVIDEGSGEEIYNTIIDS